MTGSDLPVEGPPARPGTPRAVTAKGAAPTPSNDGCSLVGKVKIVGTSPTQDEGLSPPSPVSCPSSSWHFFARSASC